ncbi:hypothetical protein JVT61DRAFT_13248 [Boletus reticuloceps]|uniref:Fungal-type protein kinase domain-containing protein n=1 Tax=Boletus reticuloceps TaxID=495285 RepID=A0A8I3ABC0_9AGAM|nr:hypothetical protein JVT61DRAFT_13248 [Boletus reticuloceps]
MITRGGVFWSTGALLIYNANNPLTAVQVQEANEAQGVNAKKRKASTRENPTILEEEPFFHLHDKVKVQVSNGQLDEDVLKFCLEHDREKNQFTGTRAFMAVERLRGCRTGHSAVARFNKQSHDLEGFFYVLAALCTWFLEPYTPKVLRRASFLCEWLCSTDYPLREQARNKWLNLRCHGESFLDENLSPYFVPAKSALQRLSELVLPPDWRQIEAPESEPVHPPVTHAAMIQVLKEEREKLPEEARIPWQPTPQWKETVASISSDGILANNAPSPFTPRVENDGTFTILGSNKVDLPHGCYRAVAPGVTLPSDSEYMTDQMKRVLENFGDVYLTCPTYYG